MESPRPAFDPDRMAVAKARPAVPSEMTVSQLNALIKLLIADSLPGTIHLVGEISNLKRADSGHFYLTLKDKNSEIRAVVWRSAASAIKFKPTDGMEVIATGHVEVYEPRGQYQFIIRKLEPRGTGALDLAFRQLHARLAKEGLFDKERKKPLPRFPQRIAVVTSPTGAAIRDILRTLQRRFPCVWVFVYPVRVQGEGAAEEIATAIRRLNEQSAALGNIDVIIVGRGGGSLEDLWAFNEEIVARAVVAGRIPIISGVGHEVDVTICDLAADLRAPTPTAAAVAAVPSAAEILNSLTDVARRLGRAMNHQVAMAQSRLAGLERLEWFRDPLAILHRREQSLDEIASRLRLLLSRRTADAHRRLNRFEAILAAIQPKAFLQQEHARVVQIAYRLNWALQQQVRRSERRLELAREAFLAASPAVRIPRHRQDLKALQHALEQTLRHRIENTRDRLDSLEARLQATSYRGTLARGFTITRRMPDRRIITAAHQVSAGQDVATETAQGEFISRVNPLPREA
ncbi:MAG TPA: exodeoxyribonuclease VII large subunit [Phycisphaerae bacterium]|nr:exodeoxyribonuclease VII large subunit [Phycisphaerae bacterium]HRR86130.1 exodeoxyribonuclease VII large subunit [Phycisphaerae bacterium]